MTSLKDKRTCRIFFSSPFNGMEGEREELTRRYFPRIHHLCASRGIQFVAVDMRWGITSEASSSAQVINICLRELDRSDIFVGFFGQRYGWFGAEDKALQENFDNAVGNYPWLGQYRDKSVTELEFLHGHLNNPGLLPAVICFRDKAYDDTQREKGIKAGNQKEVYKYSAESDLSVQLMDDLKKRVKETENKTLGVHMSYKTPAKGAEIMFNDIWKYLTEVLLKGKDKESKFSRIRSEHEAFLSSRSLLFIGKEDNLQVLTKNINSETPQQYLITGPAGSGKSSLLCTWLKQLKSNNTYSDLRVVYHFVGSASESTNIRSMLIQLIVELERQGGVELKENTEEKYNVMQLSELVNQIVVCCERILSQGKTPVLVVDGIDKLKISTKVAKPVYWLPTNLPAGTRVIISTKSSDTDNIKELVEGRKFTEMKVLPLTAEEQRELSQKTLMESGKELSTHQLEKIIAAKETQNPLFLKITLNELVVFGYFRLLDNKIESLISSDNVVELFDKVLQRLEDDYNVKEYTDNLVELSLCSICLSNSGLSETDLKSMYKIPDHVWSPLYFALKTFIIEQNGLIRFAFTELEEAVSKRYLKESSKRKKCLATLIHYFEDEKQKLPVVFGDNTILENRLSHELPWLYLKHEDYEGLQRTLLHLTVFHVLYRDCMYDLIELWNKTGRIWKDIAEMYMKQIDLLLVDYNQWIEDNLLTGDRSPALMLLETDLLDELSMFIENVSAYSAVMFIERYAKIKLQCIEKYPERYQEGDKDAVLYSLACQNCEAGNLDISEKIHLECLESRQKRYEKNRTMQNAVYLEKTHNGLGTLYLYKKEFEKSEFHFQKCKELQEPHLDSITIEDQHTLLMNLGVICIETGKYEEALKYCLECKEKLEKLHFGHLPESIGQLLTNLGLCYRRLGKLDEAEKIYQQSIKIKINAVGYNTVDVAKTLINLGTLENGRKNFDKALEYYKETVKIFQAVGVEESEIQHMLAKENLILAYLNLERFEEALEKYRPWFRIAAETNILHMSIPFTHQRIIQYLTDQTLYDEAEDIALKLLDSKDRNASYFVSLHKIDMKTGKITEREHRYTLEYGLELFPNEPYIIEHIIKDVYVPKNEIDKLVALLESRQSVLGAAALYDAANTWFNQSGVGTFDMLIAINLSAIQFVPDNAMFLKNVAVSYLRLRQYEEALPHFLKICELEPDNPQNLFWVAQSSCLCGDFDMSKKHCNIIKEKFPDNDGLVSQVNNILDAIKQAEAEMATQDE